MLKHVFDSSFVFKADFLRVGACTVTVWEARCVTMLRHSDFALVPF